MRNTGSTWIWIGCAAVLSASGPARAQDESVKAAVIRSTGTIFLGMTIWEDLNSGWSAFGDVPVEIDYTTLGGYGWGLPEIEATGADVLVLSNPAFLTYSAAEILAVKQYVESGHGLIISYGKFRSEDRALAPLVGLSESIRLGTGTSTDPLQFELKVPDHPLFGGLDQPYVSGVPYSAWPYPGPWEFDGGVVLADKYTVVTPAQPGIVARETIAYRGLYFSHYIEAKSGGTNQQDMQVFYNGLVWTGTPEPASGLFLLIGSVFLTCRRAATRHG